MVLSSTPLRLTSALSLKLRNPPEHVVPLVAQAMKNLSPSLLLVVQHVVPAKNKILRLQKIKAPMFQWPVSSGQIFASDCII